MRYGRLLLVGLAFALLGCTQGADVVVHKTIIVNAWPGATVNASSLMNSETSANGNTQSPTNDIKPELTVPVSPIDDDMQLARALAGIN